MFLIIGEIFLENILNMLDTDLRLYKKLYLIRKAEQVIIDNYFDDEMKTPMHMSRGGEHIPVGVISALNDNDQVFSTYRTHAIYLAKTGETDKFFAEMYGKKSGAASGKSGSMHLACPEKGFMSSSAIVASNIPVAVGTAWANKMKNNDRTVVVFFGDGAVDEGVFWESINMACLWRLSILFIYEDNDISVFTSSNERHGYYCISDIIDKFELLAYDYETTRVDKVYRYAKKALYDMREKNKPSFIKFRYHRYLEHVGVNDNNVTNYHDDWIINNQSDPVKNFRSIMRNNGIDELKIREAEEEVDSQVDKSLEFAKKSGFSDPSDIYKDVFCVP
jgi:acetoin:2,6-dichlorophenolindophenol oxidoreductase subunit alpha